MRTQADNHPLGWSLLLLVLALFITGIGYLDYRLGFGFNLFPLYLIPLAVVSWNRNLASALFFSSLAGAVILLKLFLIKHLYAQAFFWYWDGIVKISLLMLFSYGLWRIRELSRSQQEEDAAKIKALNESLKVQVQQLQAAHRELADVSYTISHDLRAPLRHIIGYVELLSRRSQESLDQKSRHYLQVISQATQKMGSLIDGLLAFSQLGRTELEQMPVDMSRVVQDCVQELHQACKGREVVWDIEPLPTVVGDRAKLQLVMFTLIENAVKFTAPRRQARVKIGAVDKGQETLIYVKDNGVGFDMKYVHKLFGIFQRLHSVEEFEGIGVGLANVKRIIERHGGRVWAEGSVNEGATFWFSLSSQKGER